MESKRFKLAHCSNYIVDGNFLLAHICTRLDTITMVLIRICGIIFNAPLQSRQPCYLSSRDADHTAIVVSLVFRYPTLSVDPNT